MKPTWATGFETGQVKVLLQTSLKGHPDLKDVPIAINHAKTKESRQLLEILDHAFGTSFRSYSTPPGTPAGSRTKPTRASGWASPPPDG